VNAYCTCFFLQAGICNILLQCLVTDYCAFKNEIPLPNVNTCHNFLVFMKVRQLKYVSKAIILHALT